MVLSWECMHSGCCRRLFFVGVLLCMSLHPVAGRTAGATTPINIHVILSDCKTLHCGLYGQLSDVRGDHRQCIKAVVCPSTLRHVLTQTSTKPGSYCCSMALIAASSKLLRLFVESLDSEREHNTVCMYMCSWLCLFWLLMVVNAV